MKKIPGVFTRLALVASLGLGVVSCTTGGTLSPSVSPTGATGAAKTGNLEVRVTDAPPKDEVTSIMLTVSKLAIHKAVPGEDMENGTATPTNTTVTGNATVTPPADTEESWITVPITGNETFDLIKLKGVEDLLGAQKLDVGKYTQVRLTVDKATVTIGNGTPEPATVSSGELKFVHPFDVVANKTTVIVMDFDAEESVNIAGNGKITIKPVVKLLTKGQEDKPKDTAKPTSTVTPTPTANANATSVVMNGTVLGGGDTTAEGLQDAPRTFVYQVQKADNSTFNVTYTAYPPSPAGDVENAKIELDFHAGTVQAGDYLEARGVFDETKNQLTVASEGDYIKTYATKP